VKSSLERQPGTTAQQVVVIWFLQPLRRLDGQQNAPEISGDSRFAFAV